MKSITRSAMLLVAFTLALLGLSLHAQQTNPKTGIRWNAATNCTTAGYPYVPADGQCEAPGTGGTGSGTVAGQANGVIPLATGPTAIGAQSALSDSGVNVTSTEPIEAPIYPTTYLFNLLYNSNTTGPETFVSLDGVNVQPATKGGGSQLFSTSAFRDPRLLKVGNTYFLSYTAANFTAVNNIGLAYSTDLQNWTIVSTPNWSAYFTGTENNIANGCWFFDTASGTYYLYFAGYNGTGPYGTPYQVTFNPSTKTFGTPQAITLSPTRQYAWPMNVFKIGSTYYYLLQSFYSSTGYVELASSASISSGSLTIIGAGNWAGWNTTVPSIESGAMTVNASGQYEALFNTLGGGATYYSLATPGAGNPTTWTWSAPVAINSGGISQISVDWVDVVPFSDMQTDQVLNALGRAKITSGGGSGQLAQAVVASPVPTLSFSGLSGACTDMKISITGQVTGQSPSGTNEPVRAQFNGDTSTDYNFTVFDAHPANNQSTSGYNTQNAMFLGVITASASGAYISPLNALIQDYSGTLPSKPVQSGNSFWNGSDWEQQSVTGGWNGSSAITSVSLALDSGNFTTGTIVTLTCN